MRFIPVLFLILTSFVTSFGQKGYSLPNIYFSGHLGFMPDDDFHISMMASMGYQFSDWVGLGLQIGAYTEFDGYPESFNAWGLQYRISPGKHWVASTGLGFGWNYEIPNDCMCEIRYVPGWYPFFNLNGGYRIGKVFTLGAGIFYLPKAQVETQWYDYDIDGNIFWEDANTHSYSMSAFQFTLGINLH